MKSFFSNKIIVAGVSFVLGAFTMWGFLMASLHVAGTQESTAAFRPYDPFEEMRQMQSQALKSFEDDQHQNIFDDWKKYLGTQSSTDFQQREDKNYLYYEFDLNGQAPKEVNVEVKQGQVVVSAKVEAQEKTENSSRFFTTSFHRSFPLPTGVDGRRFQTEQEGGKIVIKFPKMNS